MEKLKKMKLWKKVLIISLSLFILSFLSYWIKITTMTSSISSTSVKTFSNNIMTSIMEIISVISMLTAGIIIYFVPTFIANDKKHKNKLAIALINIFLGWSLIGWVASLVWACTTQNEEKTSGNKYENLEKLQKLKEQGIITEEEFENEKNKLLK